MKYEKIQLKSIKLESLNSECLVAVNRCLRHLKQQHDIALKLMDSDVLMQISKLSKKLRDPELTEAYQDLKSKLVFCVTQNMRENSK